MLGCFAYVYRQLYLLIFFALDHRVLIYDWDLLKSWFLLHFFNLLFNLRDLVHNVIQVCLVFVHLHGGRSVQRHVVVFIL